MAGLRPGDVLLPTGRRVLTRPWAGIHTPTGKLEVTLRQRPPKNGLVHGTWNARTRIAVLRRRPAGRDAAIRLMNELRA